VILEAALWCLIATSTLLLGTWITFQFQPSSRIVGLVMGFGAGALIAAVAYELFPETTFRAPGAFFVLCLGAIAFYLGTSLIERRTTGKCRKGESDKARLGKTIVLGALFDGIPESLVLGMTFAVGGAISIAFFGAVLVSNLPESIAASSEMEHGGVPRSRIYLIWLFVMLICVMSTVGGVMLIQIAPQLTGIYMMAAASGAVLAMLSDSMIPEGFQEGGRLTGLIVVFGFGFAAMLGLIG
jgi:zinc transporter, ZIP family